jgi:uncharacterized OB-fold protein
MGDSSETFGDPTLDGGTCSKCGYIFFPFQNLGCERCGAFGEALLGTPLRARGTVSSAAVVHFSADPGSPAPYEVAEIRLDDGPLIRALLATGTPAKRGSAVIGRRAAGSEGGSMSQTLRFHLATGEPA